MKNYCEFKYGMVDMERLYAGLKGSRDSRRYMRQDIRHNFYKKYIENGK